MVQALKIGILYIMQWKFGSLFICPQFQMQHVYFAQGKSNWLLWETYENIFKTNDFDSKGPYRAMKTYLLTPWSRVILQKLTDSRIVKKFHAFYGT